MQAQTFEEQIARKSHIDGILNTVDCRKPLWVAVHLERRKKVGE